MSIRATIFRFGVIAAVLLSSVACAGWKWDIPLH
jgi:hypothetical protein